MAQSLVLAVDLGTSFLKTVLFDRTGRIVAADRRPYPAYRPAPGLIEQAPDDWLTLIASALGDLREQGIDLDRVEGIGLSGRGGGAVLLDSNGEVLAPCWLDRRSARVASVVGPDVEQRTRGLASRIRYFTETNEAAAKRLTYALCVKDFVQFRFTDVLATDVSFAPRDGAWPRDAWAAVGFPIENLPPILPLTAIAGPLTRRAAATLGLRPGIPVGVGAHDGVCANAGVGAVEPGQTCLTLGTHGVVRVTAKPRSEGDDDWPFASYSYIAGRRTYYCDLLRAGSAPSTVVSLLATPNTSPGLRDNPHAVLTELASRGEPGVRGLTYLPYPAGQISPEYRPDARAGFIGMDLDTTPAELYRAALEGTACAFRSVVDHMERAGIPLSDLRVSGGGATNPLWMQIIADVLDRPLTLVELQESARGAAMFLATGIGWFATVEEAAAAWVAPVSRVGPSMRVAAYREVYERFRRIGDAVYAAGRPSG